MGLRLKALALLIVVPSLVASSLGNSSGAEATTSLVWTAPAMTGATTLYPTNSNSVMTLDSTRDYIIQMPSTPLTAPGGLWLLGGRNVRLVGGEINNSQGTHETILAEAMGASIDGKIETITVADNSPFLSVPLSWDGKFSVLVDTGTKTEHLRVLSRTGEGGRTWSVQRGLDQSTAAANAHATETNVRWIPEVEAKYGLFLKNQTGTVHVEGLYIHGSDLAQGIVLDQGTGATVQIQNVRIEVTGRDLVHFSDAHPDVIQSWRGPHTLRIDRLTGTTSYFGLQLQPKQFENVAIGLWDLRRINIVGSSTSRYMLWKYDEGRGYWNEQHSDLWVQPSADRAASGESQYVFPTLQWQPYKVGRPADGDYVNVGGVGSAGLSYVAGGSPGTKSLPWPDPLRSVHRR